MAGGPITPLPPYLGGASGLLSPGFYVGAGGNASPTDVGIQVVANLGSNATAQLRFPMPPSIPTGTLKLRNLMLANATTGTVKYTVQDANVAAGADPSSATLTSETQSSATISAADTYTEVKTALSATPNGNDMLVVAVTFDTSGWTLAQILTCIFTIIWE
jgi:hypothetical protein